MYVETRCEDGDLNVQRKQENKKLGPDGRKL